MFCWGKKGVWDLILPTTEFSYNNSVNRLIGKSHFQIDNGYSPHTTIDLVPLPPHMRVSKPTENFAKHIHDLHDEIKRKISLSNEEYKLVVDVHRRSKEFNVGEYVMVHIRPERIPKTFSKKLYARVMGPYSIIRKLGSNAYLLDLPNDMDISPVFNVKDFLPYRGTFEPSTLPSNVFTVRHQITVIPKYITKPEDISPGIKTKPQHSPGLPGTIPKNFQYLVRTVRNQSRKFSPDCPKIVLKIHKNSYTKSQNFGIEIASHGL